MSSSAGDPEESPKWDLGLGDDLNFGETSADSEAPDSLSFAVAEAVAEKSPYGRPAIDVSRRNRGRRDAGSPATSGGSSVGPPARSYPPTIIKKSKSTPGPGNYAWNDDVNLFKRPVWSVGSPDRANLDLMIGTWTPASSSLVPRAPDPGEYGDQSVVGRNGIFRSSKWTYERNSIRPCLQPPPPDQIELEYKIPAGGSGGLHPSKRMPPRWTMTAKDRSNLPFDIPTWTPKMNSDLRPGPGQYNVSRVPKWKIQTRRDCTWGGRQKTQTQGSRLCGGEGSRHRPSDKIGGCKTRCGCVVCPGPGLCNERGVGAAAPHAEKAEYPDQQQYEQY